MLLTVSTFISRDTGWSEASVRPFLSTRKLFAVAAA
jgi:hypothetical protein